MTDAPRSPSAAGPTSAKTPVTILLVEDEPDSAVLMAQILELEGYRVVEARNGAEALERVFDPEIRVALLDVMLPGIDGFEVCRRLRQDARTNSSAGGLYLGPLARRRPGRRAAGRRRRLPDEADLAGCVGFGRQVAARPSPCSRRAGALHPLTCALLRQE